MSIRINSTYRAVRASKSWTLMAALSLAMPAAFGGASVSVADEASLLVAKRQAADAEQDASGAVANDQALKPTPANAERTPDLADDGWVRRQATSAEETVPFGEALAEVARSQQSKEEPAKPAPSQADLPFQPATFNGIQPGTSTKEDLIATWGEPAESISTGDGSVLTYHTEPFETVEVLVSEDDVVAAVKIALVGSLEPKPLAKQLGLDKIEAVTVTDVEGAPLGQAFPERGVVFMFDTPLDKATLAPAATRVLIQPLDAQAFALRAENHLHGPYANNIRDLNTALTINPELGSAHWLLSEIYLVTGQGDLADAAATKALALEPDNAAYQLRKGQTLMLLGQYDAAVEQVRAVLDRGDVPPLVQAKALHTMGRLASLGNGAIAAKATSFETRAIAIADQLATSKNVKERRAAKQLLVEAHVSVAGEVGRQAFANKLENVTQWFGRASGLAEDFIASDEGSIELRLLIAREALATLASFKSTGDPGPWIAEAEQAAEALLEQYEDPLWQQQVQWQLGEVYVQALKIKHARRETDAALRYGNQAIQSLAEGAKQRQAVHSTEQLVGDLYFQIGAVHAIHKQDHRNAVKWYDKALPLLTSERPASELYSPRHEGESLVSIGVSFWEVGRKDNALEVTEAGAELVEIAVEDGIFDKSALIVPYGNLAAIYEKLGQTADADKYARLAKSAGATDVANPIPHTSKAPARRSSSATSQNNAPPRRPGTSDVSASSRNRSMPKSMTSRPPHRTNVARGGSVTAPALR